LVILEMGVSWTICPHWPQTTILLISASQVTRITGVTATGTWPTHPFIKNQFHNSINPCVRSESSWPNHLLRVSPPTATVRTKSSIYEDINTIQTIWPSKPSQSLMLT
jgi:hypothetical protein